MWDFSHNCLIPQFSHIINMFCAINSHLSNTKVHDITDFSTFQYAYASKLPKVPIQFLSKIKWQNLTDCFHTHVTWHEDTWLFTYNVPITSMWPHMWSLSQFRLINKRPVTDQCNINLCQPLSRAPAAMKGIFELVHVFKCIYMAPTGQIFVNFDIVAFH